VALSYQALSYPARLFRVKIKMKKYDYIIAGAGCAGLSLAYHLSQSRLRNKSVLLIDKVTKDRNDRTWCFWEAGKNPFEPIVCRQWPSVHFYGADAHLTLDLAPYSYKMIRGLDFYQFVKEKLMAHSSIEWVHDTIRSIEEKDAGAKVITDQGQYTANWVFDSTYRPQLNLPQHHNFLQHFKGWEIEVNLPTFDPAMATLMDFRIEQKGAARFFYVLPLDTQRALVEFTVFSEALLPSEEYDDELRKYLSGFLKLDNYVVRHEEFGVIPMTDEALTDHPSPHVIRIGTAGGHTKPSTGYTFVRIQQGTQAIVKALVETGKPFYSKPTLQNRFGLYDSALLNVMQEQRCEIRNVFTRMFQKNKPTTVLLFLDESTHLWQELQIMASVPSVPFLKAVYEVLWRKLRK
jgi:lycopene beta-cyclase